ncbi:hypothetical protein N2M06_05355 [Oceanimonas sp. AH20CE76]|uniref:hypothetical protein n=1 Tax=Oceanimonas sp. AH20CE76 TaxID=2977120 RepID=UPI0031FEA364
MMHGAVGFFRRLGSAALMVAGNVAERGAYRYAQLIKTLMTKEICLFQLVAFYHAHQLAVALIIRCFGIFQPGLQRFAFVCG